MVMFLFLISFFYFVGENYAQGNGGYDAPQEIKIYHSVDNSVSPKWHEKGVVTLQNINTHSVLISQPVINNDFLDEMHEKSKTNGLYLLKYIVRTAKGKEIPFHSFMKLNSFIEAGHSISLLASFDQSGSLVGIKAYPDLKKTKPSTNLTIVFRAVEQGPIPDTASYILKLEREREAKERGATQDNRSFFAKYWMYLVPVVLFAVLSGTSNAEGGGASR